ncbi:hypothetical protein ACVWY3_004736 [Bradyrhizobium sp. USDA 4486]
MQFDSCRTLPHMRVLQGSVPLYPNFRVEWVV